MQYQSFHDKQNRPTLQRRLSLKFSTSQKLNNPRMSFPARRESLASISVASGFNEIFNREIKQRPSLISSSSVTLPKSAKREVILANLLRKLDHEQQELKQIIQSKIRTPVYSQSYENSYEIHDKLKSCQDELDCFKELVKQLTNKIACLQKRTPSKIGSKTSQIGIQTDEIGLKEPTRDFMQNLNHTLKILSGKKAK